MNFLRTLLKQPGWGLLLFILGYVAVAYIVAAQVGRADDFSLLLYSGPTLRVSILLFLLFVGWRAACLMIYDRPPWLGIALVRDIRARLFTRAHISAALPVFLAFLFFMASFTLFKSLIPLLQPYVWDAPFAAWDRALHGGIDPWRLLQPVFGHAPVTVAINIVYNLWFVVMFAVLYWQLFDLRQPGLRQRFFWAFFLSWLINGSILAVLGSSAGPCFYHHIVTEGANPFAEQMEYLRTIAQDYPVWAVATQDALWQTYQTKQMDIGSGIAAMPSVHVAMAVLFALLARHYGRSHQWFFSLFAITIMIGSVHLAWHYALDGYIGAVVTLAIWYITGKFFGGNTKNERVD